MPVKKKPSAAQLAARAKFVKMVRAKAAAKKAAAKKIGAYKKPKLFKPTKKQTAAAAKRLVKQSVAAKKVAGLDKVVRKGKKTSVYYSRVSGVNGISFNDIGTEMLQLEKDILELGSFIRAEKNATERNNLKSIRKIKQDQFKALKGYLNTRAKFK
jgi:hypothetical protein